MAGVKEKCEYKREMYVFYGQMHGGDLLPKEMKRKKWTIIKYK